MPRTQRGSRSGRRRWERFSDRKLMAVRLCDLGLQIEGTWLEDQVQGVLDELADRELRVRPHFWLSEEWFSPSGVPGVAIPFWLAHPRLMRLERRQMLEVEGGNQRWCQMLLRHEVGHAVQHAYLLHRRKLWQRHFGLSSQPYPEVYRPRPTSRRHVLHLYLWYAQAHPDEDFAETFAVWLKPGSRWRSRYAGWPALEKLEYVDELMDELRGVKPEVSTRRKVDPLRTLQKTLGEYYEERKERFGRSWPAVYDRDLHRLFSAEPEYRENLRASVFLRRHRTQLRRMVYRWVGENQLTLDHVLRDMIGRCSELKLRLVADEAETLVDFSILLTVRTMQYFYGRPHKHPL